MHVVHTELGEYGGEEQGDKGLYWFRPPESKTLRPVVVDYARMKMSCPCAWSPRPPYMGRTG